MESKRPVGSPPGGSSGKSLQTSLRGDHKGFDPSKEDIDKLSAIYISAEKVTEDEIDAKIAELNKQIAVNETAAKISKEKLAKVQAAHEIALLILEQHQNEETELKKTHEKFSQECVYDIFLMFGLAYSLWDYMKKYNLKLGCTRRQQ